MIRILACHCGGIEDKAREFLKDIGIKDWLSFPLISGREASLDFLDDLPADLTAPDHPTVLKNYIMQKGSFLIVLGYDNSNIMWQDIHSGDPKSVIDAKIIAQAFA